MAKRRSKAVWTRRNRNGWEITKTAAQGGYQWTIEQEVEEAPGLVHFI